MPGFVSDKRIYLNADRSAVVGEDSDQAAFLLAGEGAEVSEEDAKKYGLKGAKHEAADAEEKPKAASKALHSTEVSDKSLRGPRD